MPTNPQTIYINPKFRNAHINPNFLLKNRRQEVSTVALPQETTVQIALPPPKQPTTIFINPNFLPPNYDVPMSTTSTIFDPPPPTTTTRPIVQAPQYARTQIISQTNRKLVRQPTIPVPPPVLAPNSPIVSQPRVPLVRVGIRKLVRRVPASHALHKSPVLSLRPHGVLQKAKLKPNPLNTPSKYRVRNSNAGTAVVPTILTRHKLQRT